MGHQACTFTLSFTPKGNLSYPPTGNFLGDGRTMENLEETYTNMHREEHVQKVHTNRNASSGLNRVPA